MQQQLPATGLLDTPTIDALQGACSAQMGPAATDDVAAAGSAFGGIFPSPPQAGPGPGAGGPSDVPGDGGASGELEWFGPTGSWASRYRRNPWARRFGYRPTQDDYGSGDGGYYGSAWYPGQQRYGWRQPGFRQHWNW